LNPSKLFALVVAYIAATGACSLAWNDYDPRLTGGSGTGAGGGATGSSGSGGATAGGGACPGEPSLSLILNPGFENGIAGWMFQSTAADASYAIESGSGIGSSNAVHVFNGTSSQFGAQVQQTPIDGLAKKLAKGDVYLVSSQLRGEQGGEQAALLLQSLGGSTRQCGTLTQAVSIAFARFGCRLRVPDEWDGHELSLNLRSNGEQQAALFDDVYLDVAPTDALYNGNFEDDFVGWSYFEAAAQAMPASIGLGPGYDGAGCKGGKSLRITHRDQDTNACGIAQEAYQPLADGASYTLSLWARGEVGGEELLVNIRNADKPWSTITSNGATLKTSWSKLELKLGPITAPLTGLKPLVVILDKSPGATIFVDGVSWESQ